MRVFLRLQSMPQSWARLRPHTAQPFSTTGSPRTRVGRRHSPCRWPSTNPTAPTAWRYPPSGQSMVSCTCVTGEVGDADSQTVVHVQFKQSTQGLGILQRRGLPKAVDVSLCCFKVEIKRYDSILVSSLLRGANTTVPLTPNSTATLACPNPDLQPEPIFPSYWSYIQVSCPP